MNEPYRFEQVTSPDFFNVWSRETGRLLGCVFREPGTKQQWKVNVEPSKHFVAVVTGEPIIGTIRGTFTSKAKAAAYLYERSQGKEP